MGKKLKKKKKHEVDWSTKPLHVEKQNFRIHTLMPVNETALRGHDYCAAMYHNTPSTDTELTAFYKKFCKDYSEKDINDCSNKIKNSVEKTACDYLSQIEDIHPYANRYIYRNGVDSFDFRKYNTQENCDILNEAFDIVNTNPDISLLFSSSEIFDILLTDSITMRVIRGQYSPNEQSIDYHIVEYTDFCLSDDTIINVPVMIQSVNMKIANIVDEKTVRLRNQHGSYETHDFSFDKTSAATAAQLIDAIAQISHSNTNDINICQITSKGYCTVEDIVNCIERNRLKLSAENKITTSEVLRAIHKIEYSDPDNAYKMSYPIDNQHKLHSVVSVALTMACIIIANNFLLQKKLSKPITKAIANATTTNKQSEIILENRPDRKTRMLGPCITVFTETRPTVMTEEKLIKYHVPEWACKGHLRHLKDGRVIEVKPSIRKRRCVDMSNVIDNRPKQATDYIIKTDDTVDIIKGDKT